MPEKKRSIKAVGFVHHSQQAAGYETRFEKTSENTIMGYIGKGRGLFRNIWRIDVIDKILDNSDTAGHIDIGQSQRIKTIIKPT